MKGLKIDSSLAEIRMWKEKVREEYENCSQEEIIKKMNRGANAFLKRHHLKLLNAPLPDHATSENRKLG